VVVEHLNRSDAMRRWTNVWVGLSTVVVLGLSCGKAAAPTAKVTAQGTAQGPAVSASIGAVGGTLTAPGLTITVPAGALTQDTSLTATPISGTAPGARGQAFRLGPEGTTFAADVTLTFSYAPADLTGTAAEALVVASQKSDGTWARQAGVTRDATAKTVSVKTRHFSDWSLLAGLVLSPRTASVKVKHPQALQVARCAAETDDDADLGVYDCDGDLATLVPVSTWAVNGTSGGDGTVGTVAGSAASEATYTAPDAVPSPDTVAVSARVSNVIVVSNVKVLPDGSLYLVHVAFDRTNVALPGAAVATVSDAVDFTAPWPFKTGSATPMNSASMLTALSSPTASCAAPTLMGPYDQFDATSVQLTAALFTLSGAQTVPAITGQDGAACGVITSQASTPSVTLEVFPPPELQASAVAGPLMGTVSGSQSGWTATFTLQQ
jgi:hypothetical protein